MSFKRPAPSPSAGQLRGSLSDALGREQASADYGTNAAAAFSRPATIRARSDTVLVNLTAYNTAGEAYQTTDPERGGHRIDL
ncbi:MAG: hypothetical protein IPM17_17705 [Verrucomicrobia bacterium]|nr:hypothetical protein [Verrucomicrobiota bacterium]